MLFLQGSQCDSQIIWTSYPEYNRLVPNQLRVPTIQYFEVDSNRDGVNDYLSINITVPMNSQETVQSVRMMLFFNYLLQEYLVLQVEAMANFHYESNLDGSSIYLDGNLEFKQRGPLPFRGIRTLYDTPVVDRSTVNVEQLSLQSIYSSYRNRNETTQYTVSYPVWICGRANTQPFTINAIIRYSAANVVYPLFSRSGPEGFRYNTH
eukprot:Colp12_sorted_trinity150504_noHs@6032